MHPRGLALVLLVGCGESSVSEPPLTSSPGAAARAPAPVAAAPRPIPAAALARLPGRVLYLAEGAGSAAIAEIRFGPEGHVSKDMLQAPSTAAGPSLFPGPIAADGAWIAVITVTELPEHGERLELRPLGADAIGEPRWVSAPAAQVRSPSWAPDGSFLVFESSAASFRDLYRLDLPSSAAEPPILRRLTDHPAGNYEPAISPDGATIAFVSSRDQNAEIYVMQADGSAPQRLTTAPLDDWGPIWAPDGQQLAFLSNRSGLDRIYLCRRDGSDLRLLGRPDRGVQANAQETYARGFEASEAEPSFTADGASILYSVRTGPGRAAIRIAPLDGGPSRDLTDGEASDRAPISAPAGDYVLFTSEKSGDSELHLLRLADGARTALTARPGPDWLARWSPRG